MPRGKYQRTDETRESISEAAKKRHAREHAARRQVAELLRLDKIAGRYKEDVREED